MSKMNPNKGNKLGLALGDTARDVLTGFEGVVVAKSEWLNGCMRMTIQPRGLKDGKPIAPEGFDIEQLELVEKADVEMPTKKAGGPMPDPQRGYGM